MHGSINRHTKHTATDTDRQQQTVNGVNRRSTEPTDGQRTPTGSTDSQQGPQTVNGVHRRSTGSTDGQQGQQTATDTVR